MIFEIWRPIVGYEGIYAISDLGRVRRELKGKRTFIGKIIKQSQDRQGYLRVGLTKNKICKTIKIHKIVASAFLGICPKGITVNHKDGIKANCRLSNLEYITYRENNLHAFKFGLNVSNKGEKHGRAKLTEEEVVSIRSEYASGNILQGNLALKYSVSISTIERILSNRIWKHILEARMKQEKAVA